MRCHPLTLPTLAFLFVGCAEQPTEVIAGSQLAPAPEDVPFLRQSEEATRVEIESMIGADLGEVEQHRFTFQLEHLPDGVSLEVIGKPFEVGLDGLGPMDGGTPGPLPRIMGGSITASSGVRAYGQNGAPLTALSRLSDLRSSVGLGPRKQLTRPPSQRPRVASRPERRRRLVTAEDASAELADLRVLAISEERVAFREIRFQFVTDLATQTVIFNDSIGAITHRTIERPGKPTIRVSNSYRATGDGQLLESSVSEWIQADGRVIRRSTKKYTSGGQ